MGIDYFTCKSCPKTFPDCGEYTCCKGCYDNFCDEKCADLGPLTADVHESCDCDELSNSVAEKREFDPEECECRHCCFCRGVTVTDEDLLDYAMELLGNTDRQALGIKYREYLKQQEAK